MNQPAVHAVSLLQFAPFLAKRDIDVLGFFSRRGFSPNVFQRHEDWLPRDFCFGLANALVEETGDPFAGALLGDQIPVLRFGELGERLARTETVLTCCTTAVRNLGLVHRGSRLTARIERGRYVLRYELEGALDQAPWQFLLATMAALRNIVLLAGEPDRIKVRLSLPRSRRTAALEATLGGNLEFGCDHDEIEIRQDLLDKPLDLIARPSRTDQALETTIRTAVQVARRLPSGAVGIDGMAAELGLTRRTLQRRLADCGVRFADLIDITRRDIAMRRLLEGCDHLKALSSDLGYSDPAHFTRTFRRWTGAAPSEFRLGAEAGSEPRRLPSASNP